MLPTLLMARNRKHVGEPPIQRVTKVRTCVDVVNDVDMGKVLFLQVAALLKLYFTLPVMTATAEQSISALRRLKSYLRTTMTQSRLNNAIVRGPSREKHPI